MQEYHLLPRQFRNPSTQRVVSAAESSQQPLPERPKEFYFAPTNNSYDSLLKHRVPSPSLDPNDEMSKLWSRISHSTFHDNISFTETRRDSLRTIEEFSDWITREVNTHRDSLLPPPPAHSRSRAPIEPVECRLSSTSTQNPTPTPTPQTSPLISKRSATPDLLNKLSSELAELEDSTSSYRSWSSTRPITPVPSLSHSCSFESTILAETPSTIPSIYSLASEATYHAGMDNTPNRPSLTQQPKNKPANLYTDATGYRNISPPMPSPIYNTTNNIKPSLARTSTRDSDVDPSYWPSRPVPCTRRVVEVSAMDWGSDDSDDSDSRLARMKKSIGDLRSAVKMKSDVGTRRLAKPAKKAVDLPTSDTESTVYVSKRSPPPLPPPTIPLPAIPHDQTTHSAGITLPLPFPLPAPMSYTNPFPPPALSHANDPTLSEPVHQVTPSIYIPPCPTKLIKKPSMKSSSPQKRAVSSASAWSTTLTKPALPVVTMRKTKDQDKKKRFSLALGNNKKPATAPAAKRSKSMGRFRRWARRVVRCGVSTSGPASTSA